MKTGKVGNFELILSRKISIKSMTRHFAQWKVRKFRLNQASAMLEISTSDDRPPTEISLHSSSFLLGRHYYANDTFHWLWIRYFDKVENCAKEVIMKFQNEQDMLRWEKSLSEVLKAYRCFLNQNIPVLNEIFIDFLKEQTTCNTIIRNDEPAEAVYFTNDIEDTEAMDALALSVLDGFGNEPNTLQASKQSSVGYRSNLLEKSKIQPSLTSPIGISSSSKSKMHLLESIDEVVSLEEGIPLRKLTLPKLTILIMAVGTRGDIQPFTHFAARLREDGHRVRLATHSMFRQYVVSKGLEFYPLAGDPTLLSEFMVKTGGSILPISTELLKEIPKFHGMIVEIIHSSWKACIEPDPQDEQAKPFAADVIISNPVTYAHVHCAEALGIPLHLMFPQPWVPTKAFPHPLSRLAYSKTWSPENYVSYEMVDRTLWLSFERELNKFRVSVGLEPLRLGQHGWNLLNYHQIPFAKMWSPSFVPKPKDWPEYVDVVGTFFDNDTVATGIKAPPPAGLQVRTTRRRSKRMERSYDPRVRKAKSEDSLLPIITDNFDPPQELLEFFARGGPIVFVGFGSMVINDLESVVSVFLEAAALEKVRVLVQVGWTVMSPEKFKDLALKAQEAARKVNEVIDTEDSFIFPSAMKSTESDKEAAKEIMARLDASATQITEEPEPSPPSAGGDQNLSSMNTTPTAAAGGGGHVGWLLDVITFGALSSKKSATAATSSQQPATTSKPTEQRRPSIDDKADNSPGPQTTDGAWIASDDAFLLGTCPHTWLFQHVHAVVHHGGAGTTAMGLRLGKPTWICPFFGDQYFWGEMVHKAGIGPKPCPIAELSLEKAVESFRFLLSDGATVAATKVGASMAKENGVESAVSAFYRRLPLENMLCEVSLFKGESLLAHVYCKQCGLKMTKCVFEELHQNPSLHSQDHEPLPCCYFDWSIPKPINTTDGIVQGVGALVHEFAEGVADVIQSPIAGAYNSGVTGAAVGVVTGISNLVDRQIQGSTALYEKIREGIKATYEQGDSQDADNPNAVPVDKSNLLAFYAKKPVKAISHEASKITLDIRKRRVNNGNCLDASNFSDVFGTPARKVTQQKSNDVSPEDVGLSLTPKDNIPVKIKPFSIDIATITKKTDEKRESGVVPEILLQSADQRLLEGLGGIAIAGKNQVLSPVVSPPEKKPRQVGDEGEEEVMESIALEGPTFVPSSTEQSINIHQDEQPFQPMQQSYPDLLDLHPSSPLIQSKLSENPSLTLHTNTQDFISGEFAANVETSMMMPLNDSNDVFFSKKNSPMLPNNHSTSNDLLIQSKYELNDDHNNSLIHAFTHAKNALQLFDRLCKENDSSDKVNNKHFLTQKRFLSLVNFAIEREKQIHAKLDASVSLKEESVSDAFGGKENRESLMKAFLKAVSRNKNYVDFVDFSLIYRDLTNSTTTIDTHDTNVVKPVKLPTSSNNSGSQMKGK